MIATDCDSGTADGLGGVVVVGAAATVVAVVALGASDVDGAVVTGVGAAGVDAPTGRQIERPGTSTVSTDESLTASNCASGTSAASAIRIQ